MCILGSPEQGKSTLAGCLMATTGAVSSEEVERLRGHMKKVHGGMYCPYAWMLDEKPHERITGKDAQTGHERRTGFTTQVMQTVITIPPTVPSASLSDLKVRRSSNPLQVCLSVPPGQNRYLHNALAAMPTHASPVLVIRPADEVEFEGWQSKRCMGRCQLKAFHATLSSAKQPPLVVVMNCEAQEPVEVDRKLCDKWMMIRDSCPFKQIWFVFVDAVTGENVHSPSGNITFVYEGGGDSTVVHEIPNMCLTSVLGCMPLSDEARDTEGALIASSGRVMHKRQEERRNGKLYASVRMSHIDMIRGTLKSGDQYRLTGPFAGHLDVTIGTIHSPNNSNLASATHKTTASTGDVVQILYPIAPRCLNNGPLTSYMRGVMFQPIDSTIQRVRSFTAVVSFCTLPSKGDTFIGERMTLQAHIASQQYPLRIDSIDRSKARNRQGPYLISFTIDGKHTMPITDLKTCARLATFYITGADITNTGLRLCGVGKVRNVTY